jgi:ditrans,polycis-polyprenyl diphosphate synthase
MWLLESSLIQIHRPNTLVEKHDVRIRVVGQLQSLENALTAISRAMETTKDNKGKGLHIRIAYTASDEIATAIKDTVADCAFCAKIKESSLMDDMSMEIPLDLMIRTSGVYRLSLCFGSAIGILLEVVERNWPDFGRWVLGQSC